MPARTSAPMLSIAALLLCLTGCSKEGEIQTDEIDYGSMQHEAAILIGDPQVYSRASLINDRRHETDYLQQLLANSQIDAEGNSVVQFSPQIVRDLKTVDALSASLGLSAGKAAAEPAVADTSKHQSATDPLQAPSKVAAPVTATHALGDAGPLLDPRDDLLDRQTYRRDIRAALAEAQLDDAHNRGGNALYRLQFEATVLPPNGKTKQWGAAKLRIDAPVLDSREIVAVYYNWLSHISSELADSPQAGHNYDYDRYVAQAGSPAFFELMDLLVSAGRGAVRHYCLDHAQGTDDQLRALSRGRGAKGKRAFVKGTDDGSYVFVGTFAVPPGIPGDGKFCAPFSQMQADKYPVGEQNLISEDLASFITSQIRRYQHPRTQPTAGGASSVGTNKSDEQREKYVPPLFCQTITVKPDDLAVADKSERSFRDASCKPLSGYFRAAGGTPEDLNHDYSVRSYTVLPVELAQRLGGTTEASQSLQTAITVAAKLSAAANGGLDAGYLKQADARAEALARQPLVVGFAGTDVSDHKHPGASYFGWLFGPEFRVSDTDTLKLQQAVRSYGVTADVSVPGWWSYLELNIDTAWTHDWSSAELLHQGPLRSVQKRVVLPELDAGYDALTEFVTNAQYGVQNARVFAGTVTPDAIPACASDVTFQISGANLWRANSVLLAGKPAKAITVLPDMSGITARFDMTGLVVDGADTDNAFQMIPLLVSAEEGAASPLPVYLVGRRQSVNGASSCRSPLLAPTQLESLNATVVASAPTSVCTDTQSFALMIQGVNLPAGLKVTSGPFRSSAASKGTDRVQVLTLTRTARPLSPRTLSLVLETAPDDTALAAALEIRDCKTLTAAK